jgi:hypothetical protein
MPIKIIVTHFANHFATLSVRMSQRLENRRARRRRQRAERSPESRERFLAEERFRDGERRRLNRERNNQLAAELADEFPPDDVAMAVEDQESGGHDNPEANNPAVVPLEEQYDNPLYHPEGGPPNIQGQNPEVHEVPAVDQYIHHNPAHVARRPDIADDSAPEELSMGEMDQVCTECDAQFWNGERNISRPYAYNRCCSKGTVRLPSIRPSPEYIQNLLRGRGREGKLFKENVRMINTKVSFASVSMKTDDFRSTKGVQTLRVGGSIKHNIGDIYPEEGEMSKFMQCFFYGGENNDRTSW